MSLSNKGAPATGPECGKQTSNELMSGTHGDAQYALSPPNMGLPPLIRLLLSYTGIIDSLLRLFLGYSQN
jgi:hypothetical protein